MKSIFHNYFTHAFARTRPFAVVIGLILTFAVPATAATYVWNGAGVDGGTGTNRWEDADNWLVDDLVPANPPGASDDVTITFNATNIVPALVLPNDAVARHVTLGGTTTAKANNRYLYFEGNAEFATLDYVSGNRTYAATIAEGSTLTLSGGDETTPTFKHHQTRDLWSYATITIEGRITITADPAYLQLGGSSTEGMSAVDFFFPETVAVDFDNRPLGLASNGRFVFDTLPSILTNQPPFIRLRGGRIEGPVVGVLDMTDTHLRLTDRTDTGTAGNARFRSLRVSNHGSSSGNQTLNAVGDIEVSGYDVFTDNYNDGHSLTGAVFISRLERTSGLGDYSRLLMNGYDLTVTAEHPVIVGHPYTPGNNLHDTRPRSILDLRGDGGSSGTLTAPAGLWIGMNGNIAGNANSVINIGGDFHIRLHLDKHTTSGGGQYTGFNLVASTVIMDGTAPRNQPQLLEAHGEDLGETLDGQVASNLAIGRLEVGTPAQPTHVRLVDLADFNEDEEPDALYVGELVVHADSTLDLCGLNLYVNGVSAWGNWRGFGDGMVVDCSIPSGTLMMVR